MSSTKFLLALFLLILLGGDTMAAGTTNYCSMLKDKFPFEGRMTSMSDLASSCGIAGDSDLGVNQVYMSYNRKHLMLTDSMCRIGFRLLSHGGAGRKIEGSPETHHYPHGMEQTFSADGFTCRAFTCFDALNTPVVHLKLESSETRRIVITLNGVVPAQAGATGEYEFDPSAGTLFVKRTQPRTDGRDPKPMFDAWAAMKPGFEVGRSFLNEDGLPSGTANSPSVSGPSLDYELISMPIIVSPGKPVDTYIAFVFSAHEREFKPWAAEQFTQVKEGLTNAEESARSRWNALFRSAPEPKTDNPKYRDLYYHSIYVLQRSLHHPGGEFGSHYASFPAKGNYDAHWLWDSAFHAVAFAEFEPKIAEDLILIPIENQFPDGRIPHFVTYGWVRPEEDSQPPVIAWCAWKVYERTKDKGFLEKVYGPLGRNTDWWMRDRDLDGDGLLEWAVPVESGWDNSPRWDSEFGKLESCDLNAYIVMQIKVLADMADVLGKPDEAREWRSRADNLGQRMVEKLYSPEENLFKEIRYDTHEPVDILTPAAFLALWAGVPIEQEKADAMIRDYLLNPKCFWGEVPFPVVAFSDPKYTPSEYWRGPTWVNISYFMVETLRKHGFHAEADEAVKRLLDICAKNTYIHEYYNSQTGEGLAVREYGWTAAFSIEMLLERYRE